MNSNIIADFEDVTLVYPELSGEGNDRRFKFVALSSSDETLGVKITKVNGYSAGGYGVHTIPAATGRCEVDVILYIYRKGSVEGYVDLEFTIYKLCPNDDYDRQMRKHYDDPDYPIPNKEIFLPVESKTARLKL